MAQVHPLRWLAGTVMVGGALLLAACGSDSEPAATPVAGAAQESATVAAAAGNTLEVVLVDFAVRPAASAVPAGAVTFAVRNGSAETGHELVVIRSDVEPGALPQVEGRVDETQVEIVGEVEGLGAGAEGSTTIDLSAGRYLLICNIAGHYALGMVAPLTVQ